MEDYKKTVGYAGVDNDQSIFWTDSSNALAYEGTDNSSKQEILGENISAIYNNNDENNLMSSADQIYDFSSSTDQSINYSLASSSSTVNNQYTYYDGNDTLVGGAGFDEFVYKLGSGNDVVQNAGDSDVVILTVYHFLKLLPQTLHQRGLRLNFLMAEA